MTRRNPRLSVAGLLVLGGLTAACNRSTNALPPALFDQPNHVELTCFAGEGLGKVVPLRCCNDALWAASEEGHLCGDAELLPHALITQRVHGVVAAADLKNNRVLDSDRRVPGYTFVDVGGLPTAIVTPPALPNSDPPEGPIFTYVAGRQDNSVRAIATCHFQVGDACGPETERNAKGLSFDERSEVQLAGEPQDMVLAPDGKSLWLTLPERGLLARVFLGVDEPKLNPFALEGDALRAPEYFPLASGIDLSPPEPVAEANPYVVTCGLGYDYDPENTALKLPLAPRAASTGTPRPTRMRLVLPDADAPDEPPVLYVADYDQAVLHVFSLSDEGPTQRALLPVGAPLRDFVVTPRVPAEAPALADLLKPAFAYGEDAPAAVIERTQRYLYGIDARDGSLMAFSLKNAGDTFELTPLLAPAPAFDPALLTDSFRDRLSFGSTGAQARSLEVVDTRRILLPYGDAADATTGASDDQYCGDFEGFDEAEWAGVTSAVSSAVDRAKRELKAAQTLDERAVAQHALDRATHVQNVVENVGPASLRGVFLMVASATGGLAPIDIHDLDLQCRVRANCDPEQPQALLNDEARGVAVQRHAPRLNGTVVPTVNASSAENLLGANGVVPDAGAADAATADDGGNDGSAGEGGEDEAGSDDAGSDDAGSDDAGSDDAGSDDAGSDGSAEGAGAREPAECPAGYYKVDSPEFVCSIKDPWLARGLVWSAEYQGPLMEALGAVFQPLEDGSLALLGPAGLDFCKNGVNADEGLSVALLSQLPEGADPACARASADEPWTFPVLAASQDRLILKLPKSGPSRDQWLACFPRLIDFDVRFSDAFRIGTNALPLLNRVRADEDGTCVANEAYDERFRSKAKLGEIFVDPFVAFTLVGAESNAKSIAPSIGLGVAGTPLVENIANNAARLDVLPAELRFFGPSGYFFVVDAASQGLQEVELSPKFLVGAIAFR